MASSLAQIKNQIEKLQRKAAALQSGVVARIRSEIAKHGLTVEDLFGSGHSANNATALRAKVGSGKRTGADKPAKFADGQGNTWHGIGKRPQWIHEAIEAGRKLEEFLLEKATAITGAAKKSAKVGKRTATSKKVPAKKAAVVKKAPAATRSAAKRTPKTSTRAKAPGQPKAPASNRAVKVAGEAKPARKVASKTTTKKVAKHSAASAPAAAAETQVGQS
ncbi:H-NS family nucleoid-associated regulatory protein [Pelomonas sp. KK5]|uniref:H-NS histone family protein n=1 Tax=Pelomonas sp. KK5 TaxID=1855730 RepID=UPI00097C90E3|nr:H-NS family nucleoid-associated regulatory protein [Pelomonas sp. KK5]